ncbi:hypothetical protein [Isoptericola sp. NPDC057191]|uniref:hypothetical protein n=1 Tax=Isoptericola sp. NPDC057191 TaxID=3346041 RepID=UPI003640E94C
MKRTIAVILAGAVLATGLTVAPAVAASSGSAGSISHPDVVLYKGQHNKTASASYSVKKPTAAQVDKCFTDNRSPGDSYLRWDDFFWTMDVEYLDRYGNLASGGDFLYSGTDPASGKTGATRWYEWDGYGRYTVRATVTRSYTIHIDGAYGEDWYDCTLPDATYSDAFYFKRATYLSTNAAPEPVRKGSYVTVKGSLRYWNPDYSYGDGAIRPLTGRAVKIYFDPTGPKGPVYKATAKTSSKGTYAKKLKQSASGTWVVKYAGTGTLTARQAKDWVTAR